MDKLAVVGHDSDRWWSTSFLCLDITLTEFSLLSNIKIIVMKQFVFLLSLSTLLIASACSKSEDDKSSLDKTSITLNRDKTIQLNVSTGNNSVNW